MSDVNVPWSAVCQKRAENYLACLTAAAGFSLSWVDNPVFMDLMEEYIPAVKLPSCKVLTQ